MVGIKDGKGRVLEDTGSLFKELATEFPSGQYTSFCNKLGVRYNEAKKILKRCLNDYTEATEEVLSSWESKSDDAVSREALEKALKGSQAGGLCSIVKKHFSKVEKAKRTQSHEEDEDNKETPSTSSGPTTSNHTYNIDQSGATNTINASGSSTVKNNTMIGQQINFNSEPSTSPVRQGKRKHGSSDSVVKRKKSK